MNSPFSGTTERYTQTKLREENYKLRVDINGGRVKPLNESDSTLKSFGNN